MSFCLLFFFFNQWYNFLVLLMLIPTIGLAIVSTFLIVETPMFLYYKKRDLARCIDSLHMIATYNGKQDVMPEVEKLIREGQSKVRAETSDEMDLNNSINEDQSEKEVSIKDVITNRSFVKTILAVSILQFSINMFYYGIQYSL